MKKNVRNALAISGLALAIGTSGLTLTASANNGRNDSGLRFERHQSPSKITRSKKVDRTEKGNWHRRATVGIVSSVSDNSIEIKKGDKIFLVPIIPNETRLLNKSWNQLDLAKIKEGDKVRIFGILSEKTIAAQTIRNISR